MAEHIFDGPTDGRQSDKVDEKVSRFRPRYRALTPEEKALHDEIKLKAEELEILFGKVATTQHRYLALAITALEQSIMWAIKALTA